MPSTTLAIVGGGPAGVAAASTMRSKGFDGRLVIVEPEADAPYERPPLSKAFLAGTCSQDSLRLRPAHGSRTITLRTVKDALALRPSLTPGAHILVAGAGFIGCEVAATARETGAEA